MEPVTINNSVYTPKLNFAFYKQTRDDKELRTQNTDGFTALVEGLLDENVDVIISTYYHSLAWYKRNQPSETDVEEALEQSIFASDEATEKAFDDILDSLQANDFLARKLSTFVKDQNKNADLMQKRIDKMEDGGDRDNYVLGLEQITESINKLKAKLTAGQQSSPKQEESDSHQEN